MKTTLRVGVLGWGAIGREIGRLLQSNAQFNAQGSTEPGALPGTDGFEPAIELVAVASRFSDGETHTLAVPPEELGHRCDVVVEAAGPDAVRTLAERYLADGADVIVVSIGALVDDELRNRLITTGPGRLLLCPGAIGGLDLLNSARLYGRIDAVRLETTKPSAALVRDWMEPSTVAELRSGDEPVECFRGSVADAVRLFPESLNVSAALGLAAGSFDLVEVVVTGSPTATTNRHDVSIDAAAGHYRISVSNNPSPTNPRTSHITAWSALRTLRARAVAPGEFL